MAPITKLDMQSATLLLRVDDIVSARRPGEEGGAGGECRRWVKLGPRVWKCETLVGGP